MKRRILRRSQFDEFEDWEQQEMSSRNEFHDDTENVNRANTVGGYLSQVHQRNKKRIMANGIEYSKDHKKRTS